MTTYFETWCNSRKVLGFLPGKKKKKTLLLRKSCGRLEQPPKGGGHRTQHELFQGMSPCPQEESSIYLQMHFTAVCHPLHAAMMLENREQVLSPHPSQTFQFKSTGCCLCTNWFMHDYFLLSWFLLFLYSCANGTSLYLDHILNTYEHMENRLMLEHCSKELKEQNRKGGGGREKRENIRIFDEMGHQVAPSVL